MTELELQDAIIRQGLELQRLSAGEEARAIAIMASLEADLRELLAIGELSNAGRREIAAALREATAIIESRYGEIAGLIDVQELVQVVSGQTVAAMQLRVTLTDTRLRSLADSVLLDGAPTADWWAKQAETTAFNFAREVRMGVVDGDTNERIVSRLVGRDGEPGILDKARRDVRTLVHSSIMSAANHAVMETYRANRRFLDGVRWLATLDSHSCITCMAYDRKAWDFDGKPIGDHDMEFRAPPAHPNCRCKLSPVPKRSELSAAIDAGAVRATANGPVAMTDFAGFLSRQSPEFVRDVLGVKRAELWQAGKITLADLVSGQGRPLTLREMAERR